MRRTRISIMYSIKNIFSEMGIPQAINCDGEFDNKMLNQYFIENDITTFYSQPYEINKQAIVERFNRTLCGLIQKWRVKKIKNMNFFKNGERGFVCFINIFRYLIRLIWFLITKLVAWKSKDWKSLIFILIIELSQLFKVLLCMSIFWGNIDNHSTF